MKWKLIKSDDFPALLDSLDEAARQGIGEIFRDRREPGRPAKILFRQAAAEYARFHPNFGDRPGIAERWNLFLAALKIARGKGLVPSIHPTLPEVTFESLEQPLGGLKSEVMQPIESFFMSAIASQRYCGSAHFHWPIVDGFRALALTYPIMLWLIRWQAAGNEPQISHAITAIQMIDRSHEYGYLAGYRHRNRLKTLVNLQELDRLIVWYAR